MIKNKVSVILPTYNEAMNIFLMIAEICNNMRDEDYEIIVVDDNSPDGTSQVVEQAIVKYPQVKLVKRTANRGLVPSISEGIDKAGGDICIWMDADLTMSPSLISKFVEQIEGGADLVLGSRYINGGGMKGSNVNGDRTSLLKILRNVHISGDSVISLIISKVGNLLMRFILDPSIHDYTSGFFGGKKEFLLQIGLEGGTIDYCITLPFKAKRQGFNVVEIPMILTTRKHGESKTSNTFLSILQIIIQCYKKALQLRFGEERGMPEKTI
jgi:dolichol-phosphate mannosyltransferase